MRILVCVKQVYDPQTVKISRSREELDLREAVKVTNPADRYALEAALRLRETAGDDAEVIALTIGGADAEDTAREAVAMGADRATLIVSPELVAAGGGAVARAVAALAGRVGADAVFTGATGATGGSLAGVDGSGTLPARLGAALGWPVALDVVAFDPPGAGGAVHAVAVSDDGGGLQLTLDAPFVAAIVAGPERPRYPHPARIANAWSEGLVEVCTPADIGLDVSELVQEIEVGGLVLGPERARGEVIGGAGPGEAAAALVEALRSRRLIGS